MEGVDPASRADTQIYGNVIGDARKLDALEKFMGTCCLGTKDPNPNGQVAPILMQAFDKLLNCEYAQQ